MIEYVDGIRILNVPLNEVWFFKGFDDNNKLLMTQDEKKAKRFKSERAANMTIKKILACPEWEQMRMNFIVDHYVFETINAKIRNLCWPLKNFIALYKNWDKADPLKKIEIKKYMDLQVDQMNKSLNKLVLLGSF